MELDQIIDDELILVGDKVDLVTQAGEVFRTMIEDKHASGLYLAGIPSRKGVYMHVEQNNDLYLVFYRDTGRYIAHMKVIALERRGAVHYMWLAQKTKIQQNQRREAFRLPVSFDVQIFEYVESIDIELLFTADEVKAVALEVVSSRDISVTGIALMTKREYEPDEKCLLSLHFSRTSANIRYRVSGADSIPALHLTAVVKRCIPWRTGRSFNTGMHFIGMTKNMRDSIARYVVTEQQRQLKRKNRFT